MSDASVEWQRVSPRYVWVDLVERCLGWLVCAIVFAALAMGLSAWWWIGAGAALVILVLWAAWTPRRVRSIGYLLRADDFVYRRGIWWYREVAVPYGRMQLVDVTRGPMARMLGLAELKLVTAAASTAIELPGLPFVDAEALRDRLVALAESRRAGL